MIGGSRDVFQRESITPRAINPHPINNSKTNDSQNRTTDDWVTTQMGPFIRINYPNSTAYITNTHLYHRKYFYPLMSTCCAITFIARLLRYSHWFCRKNAELGTAKIIASHVELESEAKRKLYRECFKLWSIRFLSKQFPSFMIVMSILFLEDRFKEASARKELARFSKLPTDPKDSLGDISLDVSMYDNVGGELGKLGEHEKALGYLQKAMNINEKVLGEEHPITAASYNNLGGELGELGKHEEALRYLQKAMKINEKVLGEEHPTTAASYSNVGRELWELGKHEEALGYLQKAKKIPGKV